MCSNVYKSEPVQIWSIIGTMYIKQSIGKLLIIILYDMATDTDPLLSRPYLDCILRRLPPAH